MNSLFTFFQIYVHISGFHSLLYFIFIYILFQVRRFASPRVELGTLVFWYNGGDRIKGNCELFICLWMCYCNVTLDLNLVHLCYHWDWFYQFCRIFTPFPLVPFTNHNSSPIRPLRSGYYFSFLRFEIESPPGAWQNSHFFRTKNRTPSPLNGRAPHHCYSCSKDILVNSISAFTVYIYSNLIIYLWNYCCISFK